MSKQIVDVKLLKKLREQGMTIPQIAQATGWSYPTVQRWLGRIGLTRQQHIPSKRELSEDAKIQRMRELYIERGWM